MAVFKRWNGTSWEIIGPTISNSRVNTVEELIAPEYDSNSAYSVGDFVVYSDTLYKCNTAISSGGELWNSAHWTAAKIGENLTDCSRAISEVSDSLDTYLEDGISTVSNYYKTLRIPVSEGNVYNLEIISSSSGTYKVQAGTEGSISSMVDTIYEGAFTANTAKIIKWYRPTGTYGVLRFSGDFSWSVKVYQHLQDIANKVISNEQEISLAPKQKVVTPTEFAQPPYNNTIGNLDNNSIVNIGTSHNAIDFPLNDSAYFTVITCGESTSPAQTAIRADGTVFTRKKINGVWSQWAYFNAFYCPQLTLSDETIYSDFNDFPVGSIITTNRDSDLDNAPPGYNNVGHTEFDTGSAIINTMTFATSLKNYYSKSQVSVYYRTQMDGTPRIAYRTAVVVSGEDVWSDWSVLSQDGVIHSTNKIVDGNHLNYTFDDFNDAPVNTVYQIDFNVANLVQNNPSPGHSGSLMTYGFSDSTRHALVQQFIVLEDSRCAMYIRYGFIDSPSNYRWTAWEKITTTKIE